VRFWLSRVALLFGVDSGNIVFRGPSESFKTVHERIYESGLEHPITSVAGQCLALTDEFTLFP
jgi:hypothetical protein